MYLLFQIFLASANHGGTRIALRMYKWKCSLVREKIKKFWKGLDWMLQKPFHCKTWMKLIRENGKAIEIGLKKCHFKRSCVLHFSKFSCECQPWWHSHCTAILISYLLVIWSEKFWHNTFCCKMWMKLVRENGKIYENRFGKVSF